MGSDFAIGPTALIPRWRPSGTGEFLSLACGALCLLSAGFGAVHFYASSRMMIQTPVPDQLRGRMMGIWTIVYSGSVPLGAL